MAPQTEDLEWVNHVYTGTNRFICESNGVGPMQIGVKPYHCPICGVKLRDKED